MVDLKLLVSEKLTLPFSLQTLSSREMLLSLDTGKFDQVKRFFAVVGNREVSLHHEKIGAFRLDVEMGQWRHLITAEVVFFINID